MARILERESYCISQLGKITKTVLAQNSITGNIQRVPFRAGFDSSEGIFHDNHLSGISSKDLSRISEDICDRPSSVCPET